MPVVALSTTLPPAQKLVAPPAVMAAVGVVDVPTHWQFAFQRSLVVQALPSLQAVPGRAVPPATPAQSICWAQLPLVLYL